MPYGYGTQLAVHKIHPRACVYASHACVFSICSFQGTRLTAFTVNGDGEIRTLDPLLARQVLSQLSYAPVLGFFFMGLSGLEPPTSRLSGVRSNRLSYKPSFSFSI